MVVFIFGWWPRQHSVWTSFGPEALVTGADEVATVTLQDRTVVRLAPDSRLTFGGGAVRQVSLTGRAYFAVAADPRHPFTVRLPSGEIEVKGTRFDVESRGPDVRIAVVEGAVQVRAYGKSLELQANDVGLVGGPGTQEVRRVDDPFEVIGWLQDFLAFESTPLVGVVEEFRLRFGVRVEVLDEALWSRTLTGWFANQTPRQVIEAACTVLEAQCDVGTEVVTMRLRP
jgi:transmembrane sensor